MALEAILAAKRVDVANRERRIPLPTLKAGLLPSERSFDQALRQDRPAYILEIKPASPSEGHLRDPLEMDAAIATYQRHASAISVLTDRPYFNGSFELLRRVRAMTTRPILCKDFILGPYQVYEARRHGADAVLLMLSVLDDDAYRAAAAAAREVGMGYLTEVHTPAEMRRAEALGAPLIGVNNRDLKTLAVDLHHTDAMTLEAPPEALLIAESGIRSHHDVVRFRGRVQGFLVGTALMRARDPDWAARALIFGPTKICGLTNPDDAAAAARLGATHGGLIFAPESPRRVTVDQAREIVQAAPLAFAGVFVNEPNDRIEELVGELDLTVVQLHGEESPEDVTALKAALGSRAEIWKAIRVKETLPEDRYAAADRLLFDGYSPERRGGTGKTFPWWLLDGYPKLERLVLSGGISPDNVFEALDNGVQFLDVNSGVESSPGKKDHVRMANLFAARKRWTAGESAR